MPPARQADIEALGKVKDDKHESGDWQAREKAEALD
jgi:hypothetical protein